MPYEYVDDALVNKCKQNIDSLLKDVETILKGKITFTHYYIGSASRHFVTRLKGSKEGFDIDCNLTIHYKNGTKPNGKKTREDFINAINKCATKHGFDNAQDGKKVITIKTKDKKPDTTYSCDFAIYCKEIDNDNDYHYLYYDKKGNQYIWQDQGKSHKRLFKRQDAIFKDGKHVKELKDYYLEKKNKYPNQKSCELYAEAINHIWQLYIAQNPKK